MAHHPRKRKCKYCRAFFELDCRNIGRQRYCSQPSCQQASKAASQRRWLSKPENRLYFCGPDHVERVRQWRKDHPGYWRREVPTASDTPTALQEPLTPPALKNQPVESSLPREALQDSFFMQPTVVVGLIAQLTGLSLQEDIALTARRLQQLGLDILNGSPYAPGGRQDAQTPHLLTQDQKGTQPVQLGRSAAGP